MIENLRTPKGIALIAVFAALHTILSSLPYTITIGVGGSITLGVVSAPLIGIILGPIIRRHISINWLNNWHVHKPCRRNLRCSIIFASNHRRFQRRFHNSKTRLHFSGNDSCLNSPVLQSPVRSRSHVLSIFAYNCIDCCISFLNTTCSLVNRAIKYKEARSRSHRRRVCGHLN